MNLKSSVSDKGEIVTQIIHYRDGSKKTFHGVIAESIEQSEFTRFDLQDGRRIYVNPRNVNCFEVFGCSTDRFYGIGEDEAKASQKISEKISFIK